MTTPQTKQKTIEPGDDLFLIAGNFPTFSKNNPRPDILAGTDAERERLSHLASRAIEAANPVAQLHPRAFADLLAMVVESEKIAHGGARTKTFIEMSAWLRVLRGEQTAEYFRQQFSHLWKTHHIASLPGISGIVVFCYLRVVSDSRTTP